MKIGIISDTHGSLSAWKSAYDKYLSSTDLIIHCGDILYHGPRNPLPGGYEPKKLAQELNDLTKPMIFVKGNCDAEVESMVLDYPLEAPYAHLFINKYRIFVHHGHRFNADSLPLKIQTYYNIILSGHTHIPGIYEKDGLIFLNPGSPSLPKGKDQIPTIAIIDEKEINIWDISSGSKLQTFSTKNL